MKEIQKIHFIPNKVKVTKNRIKKFCAQIEVMLPEDYQEFLLTYNGGKFESTAMLLIPELDKKVALEYLYGFDYDLAHANTNLEKNYGYNFNYQLNGETLVIGHCKTETGYLTLMIVHTEDLSGIYVCDLFYDEFALEESSEMNNSYYIASTFNELLSTLTDR